MFAPSRLGFRLRVENSGPFYTGFQPWGENPHARVARRRPAGARLRAAGVALETGEGPLRGRVVAAGWLPRARRDARGLDPPAPGRESGRPRASAPGAARDLERPGPAPERVAARHGLRR